MVIPVAGSGAAIDFERNAVALNLDACDLDLIAEPRGRPLLIESLVPDTFVVLAVAMDDESLFRARQNDLRRGELGVEASFDFQAFIETELIGSGNPGERKEQTQTSQRRA